jgi:cbb3-type cytochrome oxidase maturation protein
LLFYKADKSHFIPTGLPIYLKTQIDGTNMSAIYILITISLIVAIGFLAAFIWSIRSGQYDDDYAPSVRMLKDDHKPNQGSKK